MCGDGGDGGRGCLVLSPQDSADVAVVAVDVAGELPAADAFSGAEGFRDFQVQRAVHDATLVQKSEEMSRKCPQLVMSDCGH